VTKIAETNRVVDPYRLTFDANGNLIAGSYNYMIYSIDPLGEVTVIGKTRKYNVNPLEVEPIPGSSGYVIRGQSVDSSGHPAVYKFTRPDTYEKLFESPMINAIGFDKLGISTPSSGASLSPAPFRPDTSTWSIAMIRTFNSRRRLIPLNGPSTISVLTLRTTYSC